MNVYQLFRIDYQIEGCPRWTYMEDSTKSIFNPAFRAIDIPSTNARADRDLHFLYDMDGIQRARQMRAHFARHVASIIEQQIITYLERNDTVDGYPKS